MPVTNLIPAYKMKHILILGGSYAGISTAHRLFKQTSKVEAFKITLISPNTHFYWNIASPRGIIPGQISDDKIFQPIAAGFTKYSSDQFQFILAAAKSIDFKGQKVEILAKDGSKSTISYDFLILATGSRTKEVTPFKMLDSTEDTMEILHDFQSRVEEAKTIVVAGAGFTGVETAGELGYTYGKEKKIIMVSPSYAIEQRNISRLIKSH
jgi:NADH dehydrogenase FAD-containing subunit